MDTVFFFPWLPLEVELRVGGFLLLPYLRGQLPFPDDRVRQGAVDTVLGAYHDVTLRPIQRATIVGRVGHDVLKEVNQSETAPYFALRDAVAFSGLASREYFSQMRAYTNYDAYLLVGQRFDLDAPSSSAGITTRRRDGHGLAYVDDEDHFWMQPHHVSGPALIHEPLASAVLDSPDQKLHEAVALFNWSNTDNQLIRDEAELVLTVAAFESLFHLKRGKENELARSLVDLWRGLPGWDSSTVPTSSWLAQRRPQWPRNRRTVLENWIRDCFQLRGQFAHGNLSGDFRPAWPYEEHLLLTAKIFPIAVMLALRRAGAYTPTDREHADALLVEDYIQTENPFLRGVERRARREFPWNSVREKCRELESRFRAERLVAALSISNGEVPQSDAEE